MDRLTLINSGLNTHVIDKLYRCLFVTTIGFHNTIKQVIEVQENSHMVEATNFSQISKTKGSTELKAKSDQQKRHNTKASLISALWRTFSVLMECTYKQEYQL